MVIRCLAGGVGREVKSSDAEGARSLRVLEEIVRGHLTVV
jgi:hypothetical protein